MKTSVRGEVPLRMLLRVFIAVLASTEALAAPSFVGTHVPSGSGFTSFKSGGTASRAVSASGRVTGTSSVPTTGSNPLFHAFVFAAGQMVDLGSLSDESSVGTAINVAGQVAGNVGGQVVEIFLGPPRAFASFGGAMTDLGTLGGTESTATGINVAGDVVGSSALSDGETHAFRYSAGAMTDLGTLGGGCSFATAINDLGQVTGQFCFAASVLDTHAFLYSDGVMSDIGPPGVSSKGIAINNRGEVLVVPTSGSDLTPLLYFDGQLHPVTGWCSLGDCVPLAMNISRQIVGTRQSGVGTFIYSDGQTFDLSQSVNAGVSSGVGVIDSMAIADSGQIVTTSRTCQHASCLYDSWLLNPLQYRVGEFSMSGNGTSDIVWRSTDGTLARWEMTGFTMDANSCSFAGPDPSYWRLGAIGDFDGDGKGDLVWISIRRDIAIWLMDGCNVRTMQDAGPGILDSLNLALVGAGDFDGDGKSDLLWFDVSTGTISVWLMEGPAIKSQQSFWGVVPSYWTPEAIADFDGDGKADVLWRSNDGDVLVWLMDGAAVRASSAFGSAPRSTWDLAGVADFNRDGHADALWRNKVDGSLAVWLADLPNQLPGSGTVPGADPVYWKVLNVADFDGDGSPDILWKSQAGDVSLWLMNGTTRRSAGDAGPGWVSPVWTAVP